MHTLFIRKEDYSAESSWRLLDWCLTRGADEFGLAVLGPPYLSETAWADIDALLAPFRRRVASVGDRWKLTGESAAALKSVLPHGLFTYEPGEISLEDPTVYRGGKALLSIVTHEGEGVLEVRDDDDTSLQRAGLPFHMESRWAK